MATSKVNKFPYRWLNIIKIIGDCWQGFIVVGGILYVFGYICWSLNAYHFNLGLLPAVDLQYFVAGIIPSPLIIVLYFVYIEILKLRGIVDEKIWNDEIHRSTYVKIFPIVFTLGFLSIMHFEIDLSIYIIFLFISFFFAPKARFRYRRVLKKKKSFSDWLDIAEYTWENCSLWFYRAYGSFIVFVVVGFLTYYPFKFFFDYYSSLPQEFGGVKPKAAILELDRSKFSETSFRALTGSTDSLMKVVSVKKLMFIILMKEF
ncbi:MAG: hypothetical protein M3R36_16675 [Bacteroidota bacterium]|nr:hypothetical protein [Bacteroidota bacterium]